MTNTAGYGVFGRFYDRLNTELDYAALAAYYHVLAQTHGVSTGILLDLACGTGKLSVEMAKKGFDVIAADSSEEMLSVAYSRPHKNVQYLLQDMTCLDLYAAVDITICAMDSLNHLRSFTQLKQAIQSVSLFTNPGGLFLFDVNTPYKHQHILGNNTFVLDMRDVYCVWQNTYVKRQNKVYIDLDIFERDKNGCYRRYEESFTEIAFTEKQILKCLDESGFEVLASYDFLKHTPPTEKSEKIVFVAKKKTTD